MELKVISVMFKYLWWLCYPHLCCVLLNTTALIMYGLIIAFYKAEAPLIANMLLLRFNEAPSEITLETNYTNMLTKKVVIS